MRRFHEGVRSARARAACATLLVGMALAGCDDPLSPEERGRLIRSVFDGGGSFFSPELLDFGVGNRTGWDALDVLPTAEIMVELDGEWVAFRAIAFERLTIPDTGHYGSFSRARRFVIAWRQENPRERFLMGGNQFPGSMGPPRFEEEPFELFFYRPRLVMPDARSDSLDLASRSGKAEFEPIVSSGACAWPFENESLLEEAHRAELETFRRAHGVECEMWTYHIALEAELVRKWKIARPLRRAIPIRMLPQHVPGFRLTQVCDGSPLAESMGCGQWDYAENPCVPLNSQAYPRCAAPIDSLADTVRTPPPHRERRQ